jgi:hypothetical protein
MKRAPFGFFAISGIRLSPMNDSVEIGEAECSRGEPAGRPLWSMEK